MLEKIGLPAKPSMKGSSWVLDASHCQGCAAQFTFINRKHHCRRCGGLFCGTCTSQRLVLRGQGDSPVRICDACKKLEDAARFEMRHGRTRPGRGASKIEAKSDEGSILSEILGSETKEFLSHSETGSVSQIDRGSSSNSVSSSSLADFAIGGGEKASANSNSVSVDGLRQLAIEEKQKYKILKREGKNDEALKAFKRGKELERQANALEITERKNRRKSVISAAASDTLANDVLTERGRRSDRSSHEGKDDMMGELRKLGWSDFETTDVNKNTKSASAEDEFLLLLRESSPNIDKDAKITSIDRSQVLAHKRRAIALKREGKLADAKEELKRAKVLEKQLDEQELLGAAEDSDDEILSIIRKMDDVEDDQLQKSQLSHEVKLSEFVGTVGTIDFDANVDVTDADLIDPEITAALKSFGWIEDAGETEEDVQTQKENVSTQIASLKQEALTQKRAGNTVEAMTLLKKAKQMEKDMETPHLAAQYTRFDTAEFPFKVVDDENILVPKIEPKSRLSVQKELLTLKKKALALRREGRAIEAEEELKKCRVLEKQLEETENASKVKEKPNSSTIDDTNFVFEPSGNGSDEVTDKDLLDPSYISALKSMGWEDEESAPNSNVGKTTSRSKAEIQRELLAMKRKSLAFRRQGKIDDSERVLEAAKLLEAEIADLDASKKEIHDEIMTSSIKFPTEEVDASMAEDFSNNSDVQKPSHKNLPPNWKTRREIQQELLALKRKALAHRRKGEIAMAEELLKTAEELQIMLDDIDKKESESSMNTSSEQDALGDMGVKSYDANIVSGSVTKSEFKDSVSPKTSVYGIADIVIGYDLDVSLLPPAITESKPERDAVTPVFEEKSTPRLNFERGEEHSAAVLSDSSENSVRQKVQSLKKKALLLKREGKLAEAKEELRQAKLLEQTIGESPGSGNSEKSRDSLIEEKENSPAKETAKPLSSRDRFKLQQETLNRKRNAMKLRREGKAEEAESELQLARELEAQLEEASVDHDADADNVVHVEDFLDPQLLSALKEIGIDDAVPAKSKAAEMASSSKGRNESVNLDKLQLEQRIKEEKAKAVSLKREGKQSEALDALRRAKLLQKKLSSV